jgi:hypothetical protein
LGHATGVFAAADLACEMHALDHEAEEGVELDFVSSWMGRKGEEGLASNCVQSWERSGILRIVDIVAVGVCMLLGGDILEVEEIVAMSKGSRGRGCRQVSIRAGARYDLCK